MSLDYHECYFISFIRHIGHINSLTSKYELHEKKTIPLRLPYSNYLDAYTRFIRKYLSFLFFKLTSFLHRTKWAERINELVNWWSRLQKNMKWPLLRFLKTIKKTILTLMIAVLSFLFVFCPMSSQCVVVVC